MPRETEDEATKDTLPQWLHWRYGRPDYPAWADLDEGDRSYWEHEARAVRRAVERNGFKQPPEAP